MTAGSDASDSETGHLIEVFLSHSSVDKPVVRQLGVQLQVVGASVFFDEWSIDAGESITGAIEEAMGRFDVFVLCWSEAANSSVWTRREYQAALRRVVEAPHGRLVVVRLDDTAVPDLVADLKYVDLRGGDVAGAVKEIMGFKSESARVKAIQVWLEESGIDVEYFPGYGPVLCCPECGAGLGQIEGWSAVDERRDDMYAGARCRACGWEDGGEI